jgi:hypothetical protein
MPIDFVALGCAIKHCPGAVMAAAKLNSTWLFAELQKQRTIEIKNAVTRMTVLPLMMPYPPH